MQTRERAHCARSVFPIIKKKKKKKKNAGLVDHVSWDTLLASRPIVLMHNVAALLHDKMILAKWRKVLKVGVLFPKTGCPMYQTLEHDVMPVLRNRHVK